MCRKILGLPHASSGGILLQTAPFDDGGTRNRVSRVW